MIIKKFTSVVTAAVMASGTAVIASGGATTGYTDVTDDFWAAESIEYCTEKGIMTGVGDDLFAPQEMTTGIMADIVLERIVNGTEPDEAESDVNESIEREEMARKITDAIGMKPKGELLIDYADMSEISEDCLWSINQCAKLGFMVGKDDDVFDPNGSLTRAELSAIAERVSEYLESDFEIVNIIHTNDKHGYDIGSDTNIGLDEVAALKDNTENAILVDDGDSIQGKDFASLTQGESVIEAMNLAGYDVMSAGNHEFDFGQDVVKNLAAQADFPILSANTTKDGTPFFEGVYADGEKTNSGKNHVIDVNGVKVGFFGILTSDTKTATKPTGTVGITFGDEFTATKEQISELQSEGADVIIGLFHVGTQSADGVTSADIAEMLDGNSDLDAIIDGHSHTVYSARKNGVLIAQTGSYLANVGVMTVKVDEDGNVLTSEKLSDTETIRAMDISDETVKSYLDAEQQKNEERLGVGIAQTANALWGGYVNNVAVARIRETNLGDLICDAMIDETKESVTSEYANLPIVALKNGGAIRSTIYNGEVTRKDVFNVLPFANTIYVKLANPKTIYDSYEKCLASVSAQDSETGMLTTKVSGGFLQTGGMTVVYNPAAAEGSKVISVTLDGSDTPLERDDTDTQILLATNDYIAAGGNGYSEIAELPTVLQGTGFEEITENYILKLTDNGTKALEYPMDGGRIIPQSDYDGRDYTASVYLKGASGLLPNTTAELTVDNTETVSVTTDENAIARITLKNGAHAIKYQDGEETYVDNISGIGIYTSDGEYKVDYPTVNVE